MIGLWKFSDKNGKQSGLLAIYILHSLKKQPKSGYELLSEIKEKCNGEWSPSKGTLYPLLKNLEEERLIRVKSTELRSKTIYEISSKGNKLFSEMRENREVLREKLLLFNNLFKDIMGKEKSEVYSLISEIKEISLDNLKNKGTKMILENCLSELRKIK
jgi:DNA-binding PadR family transcriptional regulator